MSDTRTRQGGFTLIEVMVSMAVMTGLLGGLFTFMQVGIGSSRITTTLARLDQETSRALERISRELIQAGETTLFPASVPPLSSSSLNYQQAVGWVNNAVQWGPASVIEFQYDPRDPNDGLDNNGNGLVDEGRVVRRINPGQANEQVLVIVTGVSEFLQGEIANGIDDNGNGLIDEAGLCFDVNDTLNLRLTLHRLGPKGQIFTRTLETALEPRN